VSILNLNEIPAVFGNSRLFNIVDCPLAQRSHLESNDVVFHKISYAFDHRRRQSFIAQIIDHFRRRTGEERLIVRIPNYIPVRYEDVPQISSVDVSLNTVCGPFSPYRQWPYFSQLKGLLAGAGISYVDMAHLKARNIEYLNHVKKSRLYVGLDTGASHYVSQVANGKSLIIQSGFNVSEQWCNYDYEFIRYGVVCCPCYKTYRSIAAQQACPFNHECMRRIMPELVLARIKTMLLGA